MDVKWHFYSVMALEPLQYIFKKVILKISTDYSMGCNEHSFLYNRS